MKRAPLKKVRRGRVAALGVCLAFGLGCEGQAEPSYRGEPLVSIGGQVEAALTVGDVDVASQGIAKEVPPASAVGPHGGGPQARCKGAGLTAYERLRILTYAHKAPAPVSNLARQLFDGLVRNVFVEVTSDSGACDQRGTGICSGSVIGDPRRAPNPVSKRATPSSKSREPRLS